jgi:hypothetical protein
MLDSLGRTWFHLQYRSQIYLEGIWQQVVLKRRLTPNYNTSLYIRPQWMWRPPLSRVLDVVASHLVMRSAIVTFSAICSVRTGKWTGRSTKYTASFQILFDSLFFNRPVIQCCHSELRREQTNKADQYVNIFVNWGWGEAISSEFVRFWKQKYLLKCPKLLCYFPR